MPLRGSGALKGRDSKAQRRSPGTAIVSRYRKPCKGEIRLTRAGGPGYFAPSGPPQFFARHKPGAVSALATGSGGLAPGYPIPPLRGGIPPLPPLSEMPLSARFVFARFRRPLKRPRKPRPSARASPGPCSSPHRTSGKTCSNSPRLSLRKGPVSRGSFDYETRPRYGGGCARPSCLPQANR